MANRGTTSSRETVSTKAVVIVPPENVRRRIVLIPPQSPAIFFMIDQSGDDIADCRSYYWVPMGVYPIPPFELAPGQFISAISDTAGTGQVAVLCTYLEDVVSG